MKKLISTLSFFAFIAITFTSCERFTKEQKAADAIEGDWAVTSMILNTTGKDSTYNTADRTVKLSFDKCYHAKGEKCNLRINISPDYSIKDDIYIPTGYILDGNTKMTLFFQEDTLYFKIDEYKKDKLKLSGTASDFSTANTNVITADRK